MKGKHSFAMMHLMMPPKLIFYFLAVKCRYEDVLLKDEDNILENFTVDFDNGTSLDLNKIKAVPYPYKTIIRYVCKNGFETVTKMPDQNITCGPSGKWIPQLTSCISKQTESIS